MTARSSIGHLDGCPMICHRGGPTLRASPHRRHYVALGGLNFQYMGMWDKGSPAWMNIGTVRTLVSEVAVILRYLDTGRCFENGGCTGEPHIVVVRCLVFPMHPPLLHGHWPPQGGLDSRPPIGSPQGERRGSTGPALGPQRCEVGRGGRSRRGGGPCFVPLLGGT